MAHDYFPIHPIKMVGCALGGVASAVGLYKVGEWCDLWGGPNLQHVLKNAEHTYNETKEYDRMLHLYEACVEPDYNALKGYGVVKAKDLHADFLKSLAAENIATDSVSFWVRALQEKEAVLLSCLQYMDKSYRYTKMEKSELRFMYGRVQTRARILNSFFKYLETHKSFFALYAEEKRLLKYYAHERTSYEKYARQHQMLKTELYAVAARTCAHVWSIVDYAQQLNADITSLARLMDESKPLGLDMSSARQLYEILSAIHSLIINDQVFVQTAQQYTHWREEHNRLRLEQERIEQQRREADRERRRIEAARLAAARERQRACELQAGYQYVNGYYNGQADASWQTRRGA